MDELLLRQRVSFHHIFVLVRSAHNHIIEHVNRVTRNLSLPKGGKWLPLSDIVELKVAIPTSWSNYVAILWVGLDAVDPIGMAVDFEAIRVHRRNKISRSGIINIQFPIFASNNDSLTISCVVTGGQRIIFFLVSKNFVQNQSVWCVPGLNKTVGVDSSQNWRSLQVLSRPIRPPPQTLERIWLHSYWSWRIQNLSNFAWLSIVNLDSSIKATHSQKETLRVVLQRCDIWVVVIDLMGFVKDLEWRFFSVVDVQLFIGVIHKSYLQFKIQK